LKIKQFEAKTEKQAMLQVKEEFGKEALIVSVKNIKPKGVFKLFKSPCVQVTAALDERNISATKENLNIEDFKKNIAIKNDNIYNSTTSQNIQDKISKIEEIINNNTKDSNRLIINENEQISNKNIPLIELIYKQLTENEVDEKVANKIMMGLNDSLAKGNIKMNDVISIIYKRIIDELGNIETIDISNKKPKVIVFVGPTGVGKTTTIAKLASHYSMDKEQNIGLITADTYRIAAVEQLRTYANILNIPVEVVYSNEEIESAIERFRDKDLIFIDTAGRSHRNEEQQAEIEKLLQSIPDKEVYLVLSITTKYNDLIRITEIYNQMTDYKVIFTKLDESQCVGNILNIKDKIDAKLSYVTFGQNVPDDIIEVNPHEIAKSILGGQ
jgi:flagellar biosynthesis protein FlhF